MVEGSTLDYAQTSLLRTAAVSSAADVEWAPLSNKGRSNDSKDSDYFIIASPVILVGYDDDDDDEKYGYVPNSSRNS